MLDDEKDAQVTGTANEAQRSYWSNPYVASFWPRKEGLTSSVTDELLQRARVRSGMRVLDIGSGGGLASLHAAGLVGEGGHVVGADISAPMVSTARRRAREAGTGNVRFVEVDVQSGGIDTAPFDAAFSQFGVMFFEDPAAAFANVREQLVPGGRLAFACWRAQELNPWFVGPVLAPFATVPEPPPPGAPPVGPFTFEDASRVVSVLEDGGWSAVERTAHDLRVTVDADVLLCAEDELAFRGVDPDRCTEAQQAVESYLSPYRIDGHRYRMPLAFHIFTAVA